MCIMYVLREKKYVFLKTCVLYDASKETQHVYTGGYCAEYLSHCPLNYIN